jgi:hypothetical protein
MAANTGSRSLNPFPPSTLFLPCSAQVPGDNKPLQYDDHHVMMATITTTSEADVDALDLAELQEAVVAGVAELQGASQDKDSIMVSRDGGGRGLGWHAFVCLIRSPTHLPSSSRTLLIPSLAPSLPSFPPTTQVNLYHGELDTYFGEHQEARARSLYEDKDFSKTHTVEVRVEGGEKRRRDGRGKGGMQAGREKRSGDVWRLCPRVNTLHISNLPSLPSLPSVSPSLPPRLYIQMVLMTTTKEAMDIVRAALDGSADEAQEGRLAQNIKAAYATMSVGLRAGGARRVEWQGGKGF